MANPVVEVTTNSYFSRLKSSIGWIFIWIILIIWATVLLWHNEHRSIARTIWLNQAFEAVVPVDITDLASQENGTLIHTVWTPEVTGTLTDEDYGVSTDTIKLKRKVEMFQWEEIESTETKENLWGSETVTTTYSYQTKWSEMAINSSNFKNNTDHQNPSFNGPKTKVFEQSDVRLGGIELTQNFTDKLNNFESLSLTGQDLLWETSTGVHTSQREIYFWNNPSTPSVGDIRVTFSVVSPYEVSVIGEYNNWALKKYITENKSTIALLQSWEMSALEMIDFEHGVNSFVTWGLRALGIFLLYVGFGLILGPIVALSRLIPFLGWIVGFGANMIAFLLAIIVGPLIIAIAWFAARPLLSLGIIALIALVVWYIIYSKKTNTPAPGSTET